MKRTLIVFFLLLLAIKVNSPVVELSIHVSDRKSEGTALGTQVEDHKRNDKEKQSEIKRCFITYVDKVQRILKNQYQRLLVFQSPLNRFFKKISLFGISDFTPYVILILAVVLGLFHEIRDFDSYSGIKLFIYVLLFIVTASIQILYVYAYGSEGIWVLDHQNVGWFFSALSFLISIFVIYVQMVCFDDILNDLGACEGISIRYRSWYITGAIAFGIGIAGFYFFSRLLVLSFFIFLSSMLIFVIVAIRKSLKIGNWKYGLFISSIYLIGTVSCLLLCVKLLDEFLIAVCILGFMFLSGGEKDRCISDNASKEAPVWSNSSENDVCNHYNNSYEREKCEIVDENGHVIELTRTGSRTYVDKDYNTYTESIFGGTVTRDNSYSEDD